MQMQLYIYIYIYMYLLSCNTTLLQVVKDEASVMDLFVSYFSVATAAVSGMPLTG